MSQGKKLVHYNKTTFTSIWKVGVKDSKCSGEKFFKLISNSIYENEKTDSNDARQENYVLCVVKRRVEKEI